MGTPLRASTPVRFPLPEIDERARRDLEHAWGRADLIRYLKRWPPYARDSLPQPFWDFERRALDLGCGLGAYVIDAAPRQPTTGFLAIDKSPNRIRKARARVAQLGLENVFMVHANAIPVLAALPPSSINALTIFYPNPWWPRKHRMKRWSYHPILPKIVEILRPRARLDLCSNEAFYLAEWLETVNWRPGLESLDVVSSGPVDNRCGRTHFERQFLARGIPLGEISCRKRGIP